MSPGSPGPRQFSNAGSRPSQPMTRPMGQSSSTSSLGAAPGQRSSASIRQRQEGGSFDYDVAEFSRFSTPEDDRHFQSLTSVGGSPSFGQPTLENLPIPGTAEREILAKLHSIENAVLGITATMADLPLRGAGGPARTEPTPPTPDRGAERVASSAALDAAVASISQVVDTAMQQLNATLTRHTSDFEERCAKMAQELSNEVTNRFESAVETRLKACLGPELQAVLRHSDEAFREVGRAQGEAAAELRRISLAQQSLSSTSDRIRSALDAGIEKLLNEVRDFASSSSSTLRALSTSLAKQETFATFPSFVLTSNASTTAIRSSQVASRTPTGSEPPISAVPPSSWQQARSDFDQERVEAKESFEANRSPFWSRGELPEILANDYVVTGSSSFAAPAVKRFEQGRAEGTRDLPEIQANEYPTGSSSFSAPNGPSAPVAPKRFGEGQAAGAAINLLPMSARGVRRPSRDMTTETGLTSAATTASYSSTDGGLRLTSFRPGEDKSQAQQPLLPRPNLEANRRPHMAAVPFLKAYDSDMLVREASSAGMARAPANSRRG